MSAEDAVAAAPVGRAGSKRTERNIMAPPFDWAEPTTLDGG